MTVHDYTRRIFDDHGTGFCTNAKLEHPAAWSDEKIGRIFIESTRGREDDLWLFIKGAILSAKEQLQRVFGLGYREAALSNSNETIKGLKLNFRRKLWPTPTPKPKQKKQNRQTRRVVLRWQQC